MKKIIFSLIFLTSVARADTQYIHYPATGGGGGGITPNSCAGGLFATGIASDGILTCGGEGSEGIESINGDFTSDQLMVTGTAGTNFAIVDNGTGTHTFNLPVASGTNSGKLSNTDWTTFNNKMTNPMTTEGDMIYQTSGVPARLAVGAVNKCLISNGTDPVWDTCPGGGGSFTPANLTDAGTDGITVTGGTSAVNGSGTSLSQHVADATHNGYLSSTDWVTFNAKQSPLTFSDSLVNTAGTVTLVGDSATPGNSKFYGTDGLGNLGYYDQSGIGVQSVAAIDSVTPRNGDGIAIFAGQVSLQSANASNGGAITTGTQVIPGAKEMAAALKADSTIQMVNNSNILDGNGNAELGFVATASAVDFVALTNAATGNPVPAISAQGSDTNIGLYISTKGTGGMVLNSSQIELAQTQPFTDMNNNPLLGFALTTSATDYVGIKNTASGGGIVQALSSNSNANLVLTAKGTGKVTTTSGFAPATQTLSGASVTPDCSAGNNFIITSVSANTTFNAPTNCADGQRISIRTKQDGTGGYTITWNSAYRAGAAGGALPTTFSGASKVDYYGFVYDTQDSKADYVGINPGGF